MTRALLFDLDETLVVEEPAAVAAFRATAGVAAERHPAIDAAELALAARSCARTLWYAAPEHDYCARVGISSWEGLWCRFEGEGASLSWLRGWAATYRREAWRAALAEQSMDDPELAAELGERFGAERRRRHETFPDSGPALERLASTHRLALVTNGASDLQREKLAASGLERHFETVLVSADLDTAKPDRLVFETAVERLGVAPADAVMIGDSVGKDIEGALAAGLGAVWVNRAAKDGEPPHGVPEIRALADLPALLA